MDVHGATKVVVLATILFLSTSPNCFAQATDGDDMLYVYTKNNKEAALYQLDDLNKITFSNSGVRLWNTNWPTEYPYSKFSVITFRDRNYVKPTGIESQVYQRSLKHVHQGVYVVKAKGKRSETVKKIVKH